MFVVCNEDPNEFSSFIYLTKGKKYEVLDMTWTEGELFYYIIDDCGSKQIFISSRFKTLQEVRKNKLKKINDRSL